MRSLQWITVLGAAVVSFGVTAAEVQPTAPAPQAPQMDLKAPSKAVVLSDAEMKMQVAGAGYISYGGIGNTGSGGSASSGSSYNRGCSAANRCRK